MLASEHLDKLATALAAAQKAFEPLTKNREVEVRGDKGSYTFSYATFDSIVEAIRGPLADNGLSFVQSLANDQGSVSCETRLLHASGQWLQISVPVVMPQGARNGAQAMGSAITYAKRYALTALLGIVSEEDDDANAADGNHIERKTDKPANGVKAAAPKPVASSTWAIKADSPEAFAKAFKEKMTKAPTLQAATKLHDDNKANLQALSEALYKDCAAVMDRRVSALSQTSQAAQ